MIYRNHQTKNISFPLGGIGTGCIGLAGNGELNDWEIFNRPNKNTRNGYSHFAIKATRAGKSTVRVLHGDTGEVLSGLNSNFGRGVRANSLAGFPHFQNVVFEGNFPLANLTFSDPDFPAIVRLCAFNPFVPHNDFQSSIPAAFFEWEIENTAEDTVEFALACTVHNPAKSTVNKTISREKLTGLSLGSAEMENTELGYSDLCILTDSPNTITQEYWYRGGWQDGCTIYWKNFLYSDRLPPRNYSEPAKGDHGTVASYLTLPAKQTAKLRFVISWNVPNCCNYWGFWGDRPESERQGTWRNYYATQFQDSFASARYAVEHFSELYEKTKRFSDALQACTLPASVKDAISANLSVIKTPTALRLEDGSFWGWEGCHSDSGSCFGTCQHVWNYAYAMPYLFPRLERSIREMTMQYALLDNGATCYRINLPLKKEMNKAYSACVDGQMGEVIKCYREWKISGDDEWLTTHSESIFNMLEYAWSEENPDRWDADMDGVLEGRQHHTLDLELFGPSSWLQGFYLLALDCGAKMAKHLGQEKRAELYSRLYKNGKEWTNTQLFNGKYFCQKIDLADKSLPDRFDVTRLYWNEEAGEIKYQVAEGCLIDQMLADWHAVLLSVDPVFDSDKKKIALQSLYRNNYKTSMRDVTNMWRNFALNDESGTVICSYPEDVYQPAIPISYCEETMTGFEYALAGLMIAEGFVDEGERMVKAVRDRYDGEKRNPWNEIECGGNYARSMASYALMPIYSGFTYDMTEHCIGFNPVSSEGGQYLWSVGDTWGTVKIHSKSHVLSVLGSPLSLCSYGISKGKLCRSVRVDGKEIAFTTDGERIVFESITVKNHLEIETV